MGGLAQILPANDMRYALKRVVAHDRQMIACRAVLAGKNRIAQPPGLGRVEYSLNSFPLHAFFYKAEPLPSGLQCRSRCREQEPPGDWRF